VHLLMIKKVSKMCKWAWRCCWFTKTDNKDSCGSWMGGFTTPVAPFFHFITSFQHSPSISDFIVPPN